MVIKEQKIHSLVDIVQGSDNNELNDPESGIRRQNSFFLHQPHGLFSSIDLPDSTP